MFEKIDLEKVLRGGIDQQYPYGNLKEMYANDKRRNYFILRNIFSKEGSVADFTEYNVDDVFHVGQIKDLCIQYNLRFLDAHLFKGNIPMEALNKIKFMEDVTGQEFTRFKIIAPAKRFELIDENADPLLFVELGNDKFLFIHKWGNDLNWYKKILSIPVRSYDTLAITAVIFSAFLSVIVPTSWLSSLENMGYFNIYRLLFFFWMATITFAFTFYFWFGFRNTVTENSWNCKTE